MKKRDIKRVEAYFDMYDNSIVNIKMMMSSEKEPITREDFKAFFNALTRLTKETIEGEIKEY